MASSAGSISYFVPTRCFVTEDTDIIAIYKEDHPWTDSEPSSREGSRQGSLFSLPDQVTPEEQEQQEHKWLTALLTAKSGQGYGDSRFKPQSQDECWLISKTHENIIDIFYLLSCFDSQIHFPSSVVNCSLEQAEEYNSFKLGQLEADARAITLLEEPLTHTDFKSQTVVQEYIRRFVPQKTRESA